MDLQFVDRVLVCSDCRGEFIFTAGEQLFFHDKQFKNDPKRCKPCKSRRSGLAAQAHGTGPVAAGLSRTETRTECSACGIQTTVPFKPTQGRPVLCRQCFQDKNGAVAATTARTPATVLRMGPADAKLVRYRSVPPANGAAMPPGAGSTAATASALTMMSTSSNGAVLSPDAAVLAATSMAGASRESSVASAADLASICAPDGSSGTALSASGYGSGYASRARTGVVVAMPTTGHAGAQHSEQVPAELLAMADTRKA